MQPDLATVEAFLGRKVVRVFRIFYECHGELDDTVGDLEIEFEGGKTLHLGGRVGEHLYVCTTPWVDPFAGELDAENLDYVREYGRFVRTDCSELRPFIPLGQAFVGFRLLRNRFDTAAGLELEFQTTVVVFIHECDESYVMSVNDERRLAWGFSS